MVAVLKVQLSVVWLLFLGTLAICPPLMKWYIFGSCPIFSLIWSTSFLYASLSSRLRSATKNVDRFFTLDLRTLDFLKTCATASGLESLTFIGRHLPVFTVPIRLTSTIRGFSPRSLRKFLTQFQICPRFLYPLSRIA